MKNFVILFLWQSIFCSKIHLHRQYVEPIAYEYLAHIKNKSFDEAFQFFEPQAITPKKKLEIISNVNRKINELGELKGYKSSGSFSISSSKRSYFIVELRCEMSYEMGNNQQTIITQLDFDDAGKPIVKLINHDFSGKLTRL